MKKIITIFTSFILISTILIIVFLTLKGVETNHFNKLLSDKIEERDVNLNVRFKKIKIKIDLKDLSIFLFTTRPKVEYQSLDIPIIEAKAYIKFKTLLKNKRNISRLYLASEKIRFNQLKVIINKTKPSNLKSFILNNINDGSVKTTIDLNFKDNLEIKKYKVKGSVYKASVRLKQKTFINDLDFNFISEDNIIQIDSLKARFDETPIVSGELKITTDDEIYIEGSLKAKIPTDEKKLKRLLGSLVNKNYLKNKIKVSGDVSGNFQLKLSNTLKVFDYSISIDTKINKAEINLRDPLRSLILEDDVKDIKFNQTNAIVILKKNKKNNLDINGFYSFNNNNNKNKFNIKNIFNKKISKISLNIDLKQMIALDLLNYKSSKLNLANIKSNIILDKNNLVIKNLNYSEGDNLINLIDLKLNKEKQIQSFKKINIKTFRNNNEQNNFKIISNKKILITGKMFDASNIIKQFTNKKKSKVLDKITKNIEIKFENITTNFDTQLKNFNFLGEIKKGEFTKILSKSEFSENEYLDISLKKKPGSEDKVLEIYSDRPKVILSNYNFFKDLEKGKMIFTSNLGSEESSSVLEVSNFKIKDAPAFAKLLALADLGGVADLLSGEGISFDLMEIKFKKNDKVLNITEIYAVGPSISILVDGYIESNTGLISLRGTMVPARELNKLISKIPVIGKILIPKETGEGLFGVSFKIKGLPGKTKTTVNPLKTLTPRFITRALEKKTN